MTRLTFTKNEIGNVYTTKELLAREKVINGVIRIEEIGINYTITDLGANKVLGFGICKNITEAKNRVKNKFKDLGVLFHDEVRKKLE